MTPGVGPECPPTKKQGGAGPGRPSSEGLDWGALALGVGLGGEVSTRHRPRTGRAQTGPRPDEPGAPAAELALLLPLLLRAHGWRRGAARVLWWGAVGSPSFLPPSGLTLAPIWLPHWPA